MKLIDADALIEQMEADAEQMEEPLAKMFAYAAINDVKHAPTVEAPDINVGNIDTTTHGPIPVKNGRNDEDRTTDDYISRTQAIDVLHGYFDGMLETDTVCPADIYGLFECMPSAQPDDDRLERCRFEYVNACKILAHRTPDTRKKDIDDAYAVVRALNPIFGEEGF